MEVLFKKYDDDGEGSVNYVSFSRDIDATETFSDRTVASASMRGQFHGGFRDPKVHENRLKAV